MPLIARFSLLILMVLVSACAMRPASDQDDFVTAIDTPHTIDLTQDPDDVWVRIRRGFAIPNLNTPLVEDRKSTRLNSSHVASSYAVFCLKKKILEDLH